ncbi:SDR family NAD(P)-dependent oxidoreductase [Actinopolymorpha pittospori]|uniref:3-oxoacyl-[acyl-carrier protein] reductase n=1 Tax=Actinopolymorpha pittospori TaxID=648752 RepID=A0A927MSV9_9ACTN|nr:SDR family oxidoreductase [Actinopolymorpha pittospori]MBE1604628.1 3-oxoacyl-[acyl-carrier protein] reductase [Actinopolymorpha pittospori]
MSLSGRTALVTGAGRGIGRAIALELADAGVTLAVVARTATELDETVWLVSERGGEAVAIVADLGETGSAVKVAERAASAMGRVDILVNNAAVVQPVGPTVDLDMTAWAAAFDLNVFAAVELALSVVPGMVQRGWGRVANVSSGVVARPGFMVGGNAYAATKAALEAHTLNLAEEVSGTGVTVNVYRPGMVDTAMQTWLRDSGKGRLSASTYMHFVDSHANGSLIRPEDSARSLVARLDGAATGQVWAAHDQL